MNRTYNMNRTFHSVHKNAYGDWTAESHYDMGGARELHTLTMKRFGGSLATSAKVVRLEGNFAVFTPYTDFSKTLINEKVRVTQKNVEAQHERIDLPALFKEVREKYPEEKTS